jgi:hypothetical protein
MLNGYQSAPTTNRTIDRTMFDKLKKWIWRHRWITVIFSALSGLGGLLTVIRNYSTVVSVVSFVAAAVGEVFQPALVNSLVAGGLAAAATKVLLWQRPSSLVGLDAPPLRAAIEAPRKPPTRPYAQTEKAQLLELLFKMEEVFNNEGRAIDAGVTKLANNWTKIVEPIQRGSETIREAIEIAIYENEIREVDRLLRKFNDILFEPSMAEKFPTFGAEMKFVLDGFGGTGVIHNLINAVSGWYAAINWLHAAVKEGRNNTSLMGNIKLAYNSREDVLIALRAFQKALPNAVESITKLRSAS